MVKRADLRCTRLLPIRVQSCLHALWQVFGRTRQHSNKARFNFMGAALRQPQKLSAIGSGQFTLQVKIQRRRAQAYCRDLVFLRGVFPTSAAAKPDRLKIQ